MNSRKAVPVALTIAGSDSGGGAGIEADLKTFAVLGVHGVVAITSITAQNTYAVTAVFDLPPDIVVKQIDAVAEDMGVDAAKTGMLSNSDIIVAVAGAVKRHGFPLVVDPVMVAKSGAPLLRPEAVDTLIKHLIPLATVVTPNRMEAERLTDVEIRSLDDAKRAAKIIVEDLGAGAAVVKGGHIEGPEAVDILYHDGRFWEFRAPRVEDGCTHGTGCVFSAAIAAGLAKGFRVEEAVKMAKEFVTTAIMYGLRVGKGHCPVNPAAWLEIPAQRFRALENVKRALEKLIKYGELVAQYLPEVGMNVAEAIDPKYARTPNDVAAVSGRIVRVGKSLKPVGGVDFGASSHLARAVLKAMELDPTVRAAANLRTDPDLVEAAKKLGFAVIFVDRTREPEEVKRREGASIPWIVEEAYRALSRVPDVVYDEGSIGKEPMMRIFGRSAEDVVEKLLKIVEEAQKRKYSLMS